jgi:hypothetical protein
MENTAGKVGASFAKNIDHISFFEKDSYLVFLYKKTEKLTTALYMVTSLFSDNEPMKWSLRKKVSELLSFILGHKNPISGQIFFVTSVKEKVLEIISLLEVSSKSGLVSPMNFSILEQEFLNLVGSLNEQKLETSDLSDRVLSKSFFENSNVSVPAISETLVKTESVATFPATQFTQIAPTIKDKISENINQNIFKKTNRQSIIIGLLKKKKELSIKDITQSIRDCSEKTIQRELISLIERGIVKKTGERRWSKYSLIV